MSMPVVGEKITIVFNPWGVLALFAGEVTSVDENVINGEDGTPCSAFSVRTLAGEIHMWSFDPGFVEGVGWCRGHSGEAVDALQAAQALGWEGQAADALRAAVALGLSLA